MSAVALTPVNSVSKAWFAYCEECDHWLGCPYWSLSKSIALHKRGTGHEIQLFAYREEASTA